MRILYLSQYFPPEMGAPAARVYELSREWVNQGHEVTVLTGFPNHPTGVIPPEYRDDFLRREIVDGIQVIRVPIYAAANKRVVKRALSYLSYSVSATCIGPFVTNRPDVLIATSPQLLTAVSGYSVSRIKRVPFIFEVRDIWPQSVVEVGAMRAESFPVRILEQLELFLYRQASRIVVVTDSFVHQLTARGVPAEKLRVIKNGVDLDLFRPAPRDNAIRAQLGFNEKDFLCLYVGTHGMAHGLATLLEAADSLKHEANIRFVFVGEGADKATLKEKARALALNNVFFVDMQPRENIPKYLAASDACFVLLKGKPLFKTVLPSKLFEIMGTGRCIVLGVDGEARHLVERAGAGVFVPPEDAKALAEAIVRLRNNPGECAQMGKNGRAFVELHFSRRALAQQYLNVLVELVTPPRTVARTLAEVDRRCAE